MAIHGQFSQFSDFEQATASQKVEASGGKPLLAHRWSGEQTKTVSKEILKLFNSKIARSGKVSHKRSVIDD